jgi:hypothetical protein
VDVCFGCDGVAIEVMAAKQGCSPKPKNLNPKP